MWKMTGNLGVFVLFGMVPERVSGAEGYRFDSCRGYL
jgi:hypothetical protein